MCSLTFSCGSPVDVNLCKFICSRQGPFPKTLTASCFELKLHNKQRSLLCKAPSSHDATDRSQAKGAAGRNDALLFRWQSSTHTVDKNFRFAFKFHAIKLRIEKLRSTLLRKEFTIKAMTSTEVVLEKQVDSLVSEN